MTSYELSRSWFDWCFENPEKINPNHSAIYFFAIEHCNRLGWKKKFGFPTQMAMDAIGIKKHQTYIKYFNDLCEWGFFELVQKSVNQYSSNIISLVYALPKKGKALDKAIIIHEAKQTQSNGQSNSSINKPITIEPNNLITISFKEKSKNDFEWIKLLSTSNKISEIEVFNFLEDFDIYLKTSKKIHPDLSEYQKHLSNWIKIQIKNNNLQLNKITDERAKLRLNQNR